MLHMPQEIEVWYILPALRKELALALLELGLKQKNIADILGITPSAVSQYTQNKRATEIHFPEGLRARIRASAKTIQNNPHKAMEEIQSLCGYARSSGFLCEVHRKHAKNLDACTICFDKAQDQMKK